MALPPRDSGKTSRSNGLESFTEEVYTMRRLSAPLFVAAVLCLVLAFGGSASANCLHGLLHCSTCSTYYATTRVPVYLACQQFDVACVSWLCLCQLFPRGCSRISWLCGSRVSRLCRPGVSRLCRSRVCELCRSRVSELCRSRVSELCRSRVSELCRSRVSRLRRSRVSGLHIVASCSDGTSVVPRRQ